MNKVYKMTKDGFTLVELMIVVAIIGVLASIAIPQYRKFQAKARQSEVRIQLAATYTVEQSFAAENSTYTSCLGQVGYARDGTKFYYTVGFGSAAISANTACTPGNAATGACTTYQWRYCDGVSTTGGCVAGPPGYIAASICTGGTNATDFFAANISEPTSPAGAASAVNAATVQGDLVNATIGATTSVSGTAFVIGAAGKIMSGAANVDGWSIDNNKQILNTKTGLN